VKRWTMRNTGNTTWTSANGYTWDYVSNERFGAAAHTELAAGTSVAPGSSYAWDVTMTAPSTPGTYRGYWRMNHSGSGLFGDNVWIEIVVVAGPAPDAGQRDTRRPDTAARDTAVRDTAARDTAARDTAARDTAAQPEAAVDGGGVGPGSDGGSGPGSDGGSPADGRTYDNVVMSGCACGAAGDVRSKGQALWLAVLLLLVTGSRLSSKRRR
ncbi:MAG: hypothetical protein JXR83_21090, partial [Deltaproteobacteria bacterium]|nr:hypothetical protein [Deltaproteobacteria bacterium]